MQIHTSTKKFGDFVKPHIPEGFYLAKLTEVKPVRDGQFGPQMAFIYTVNDKQSGKDVELAKLVYKKDATENTELGKVLIAHGVALNDTDYDTDALIGSIVRVLVEDYEYETEVDGKMKKIVASGIAKVKAKDAA